MGYHVDESGKGVHYALGICDCGARFPAFSRQAALNRLAIHEAASHPEEKSARTNARKRSGQRKYKKRKN